MNEQPPSMQDPDVLLVNDVRRGESRAFEVLVRRHERLVFRTAIAITGNDADAEEVMQDAFLKAYQHIGEFRGDSRFTTWLTRIAINEGLQLLRRRRRTTSLDDPAFREVQIRPHRTQEWYTNPEKLAATREMKELVEQAISGLPVPYRVAFVLHDIEHLSNEEAAEALGLSLPALKSRVLRARLMLREVLAARFERPATLGSRVHRASKMMGNMIAMAFERAGEKGRRIP